MNDLNHSRMFTVLFFAAALLLAGVGSASADVRYVDASLRSQGVSVHTYPLGLSLVSPQETRAGAFEFALTGPPAAYTIFNSTDLAIWNQLGTVTNEVGAVAFTDAQATNSSQKFYRARLAP